MVVALLWNSGFEGEAKRNRPARGSQSLKESSSPRICAIPNCTADNLRGGLFKGYVPFMLVIEKDTQRESNPFSGGFHTQERQFAPQPTPQPEAHLAVRLQPCSSAPPARFRGNPSQTHGKYLDFLGPNRSPNSLTCGLNGIPGPSNYP